ncbi:substrate-binding domain-containing protein [Bradyrhizobium sp. CCBAU 53421]|uniref:substrate-binding domain-containing protein n=1 Tax=Bradyrhizobium sp. CCBAU 53421 TaxID=1325120 RepID=UPI001FEF32C8|nr:substrate-binding domain-containing protein [Bradyrhizobium sp. CCBAU 53421]
MPSAPGSGAALCRGLRASSRRYHRPTGQIQQPGRTLDRIKLGGKVTISYLDNPFHPDVLEALSNQLQARGYQILLFTAAHGSTADPMFENVMRYQVDGVILASTMLSSKLARECRRAGVPIVLFNRTTDDANMSSVTGDNERGGAAIASFLLAGNHKRLAFFIAGLEESSTSRDRERGFRSALERAGYTGLQRAVGHYNQMEAAGATRALLQQKNRPDAIFCANDHMALPCIEVVRHEFGLRIPDDLSVVGFDDAGPARWKSFDLTSFSQPLVPMVTATVGMISDLQSGLISQRVVLSSAASW